MALLQKYWFIQIFFLFFYQYEFLQNFLILIIFVGSPISLFNFLLIAAYCVVGHLTLRSLSLDDKTAARSRSSANRIGHYKACLKMCIYFYAFIIQTKNKRDNNKKNKNL